MKNLGRVLSCLLLLAAADARAQSPRLLAITGVTVIDATGRAHARNMTVLVKGDRIAELGRAGQVKIPRGAHVVQAAGKFLIPGLWDMHAHIAIVPSMKDTRLRLLVANGVTGVRDLFGSLEAIKEWRSEIAAGTLIGPRIVAAGPILDGPGSREFTIVRDADEGREAVTRVKEGGSDFVKVYSLLSRDAYFAIAETAREQRIPFAGHVPLGVTVSEASEAGQKSIEHLTGMVLATSARESELLRSHPAPTRESFTSLEAAALASYDEENAEQLFARLVRNGTWQCPTLVVLRSHVIRHDPRFSQDPRLKYIAPRTRASWQDSASRPTADELATEKALYARRLRLVGEMQRAGVGILAGTDMGNPYCFPGSGLHDELELLVEAGLTPLQALQSATLNPAKYLGWVETLGTVEEGKLADLVLLHADPIADIRNIRRIDAVVLAGRFLGREHLDRLLGEAEAAVERQ